MNDAKLRELAAILMAVDNSDEMIILLRGLFTEKELEDVTRRVQIVKLLKQGVAQHVIAKKLGVGVATVTRGSMEIQKGRFRNVS